MQQATTRPSPIEVNAGHPPQRGDTLSITLSIERVSFPQHGHVGSGLFRALLDFLKSPSGRSAEAQHQSMPASAEPALLLTEADFAPPDHVLPIVLRIAACSALGIGSGGAAYLVMSLIS